MLVQSLAVLQLLLLVVVAEEDVTAVEKTLWVPLSSKCYQIIFSRCGEVYGWTQLLFTFIYLLLIVGNFMVR